MIREITSKQNDIIKSTKALLQRKERKNKNLFIIEGERFVKELNGRLEIKYIIATHKHNLDCYECENKYYVEDELFEYVSEVKSPQGILAVCEIPDYDETELFNSRRVLYLEAVQNSDNVGAIIRSAACLGYECVILNKECADPYSPKALRAAAGNTFHVKIYPQKQLDILNKMKDCGFVICGAHLGGETNLSFNHEKCVLIIGNEGNGMSPQATEICDKLVKIKMYSDCESLNAACAAAILMYISME